MIQRPIPRDISKYEAKQMLGLTTRQLCLYVPGAVLGVVVFFLTRDVIGQAAIFLALLTAMPFLLFASFKPLGLPLEKFIKTTFLPMMLAPANRRYKTENTYSNIIKPLSSTTMNKSTKKYKSKDPANRAV